MWTSRNSVVPVICYIISVFLSLKSACLWAREMWITFSPLFPCVFPLVVWRRAYEVRQQGFQESGIQHVFPLPLLSSKCISKLVFVSIKKLVCVWVFCKVDSSELLGEIVEISPRRRKLDVMCWVWAGNLYARSQHADLPLCHFSSITKETLGLSGTEAPGCTCLFVSVGHVHLSLRLQRQKTYRPCASPSLWMLYDQHVFSFLSLARNLSVSACLNIALMICYAALDYIHSG